MRKLINSRVVRTALIAGILSVGLLGWHVAEAASGPNTSNGPTVPGIVPATNGGMPPTAQVWWAVVNSNGTLARSFPPAPGLSVKHPNTGGYIVSSTYHDFTSCAFVVSLGQTSSNSTAVGYASAQGAGGNPKGVFVATFNTSGVFTDQPFHLSILC
jgi:hypothetical protein